MNIVTQTLILLFWFLVILIPLVVIHEFGHLIMARLNKVRVVEFGVGIPPRWLHKRWKGIIWSLNYLPLGGFAKIYGDHDALDDAKETSKIDPERAKNEYLVNRSEELIVNKDLEFFLQENNIEYNDDWKLFEKRKGVAANDEEKAQFESLVKQLYTLIGWEYETKLDSQEAFFNKTWWQQALILLGGVTFNLITALFLFWVLYGFVGVSNQALLLERIEELRPDTQITLKSDYPKVAGVAADLPAAQAGLKSGDELISFAGVDTRTIQTFDDFRNLVQNNQNQQVNITFRSTETGETKEQQVSLSPQDGKVLFGIGGLGYIADYRANNIFSALKLAGQDTWDYFVLNFQVLGDVVVALLPSTEDKTALSYVGGPIAVSSVSSRIFSEYGLAGIIQILALVSISLAAFNLLPVPALDGGRLVIITLNKIFRRRNKRLEALVISITFLLLLGLGVLIAFNDISKIATGGY